MVWLDRLCSPRLPAERTTLSEHRPEQSEHWLEFGSRECQVQQADLKVL